MTKEENTLRICTEAGGICIYDRDALIVELKENRWLRFRANGKTERWIGGEGHGSDQCVAYAERQIAPTADRTATVSQAGRNFTVCVNSRKTALNGTVSFRLEGKWHPEQEAYAYVLYLAMTADTEEWYRKSFVAQAYDRQMPPKKPRIQMFDYRIELITEIQRRSTQTLQNHPLYYTWFFSSPDGQAFEKWPKAHVAYPACEGNYPTIRTGDRMRNGACFGFADDDGGWMTRVLSASAPANTEICWAAYDVHVFLTDALPLRGTAPTFSTHIEMAFEPLDAEQAKSLFCTARERDWRHEPTYDIPAITAEPRFDRILSEMPSEETGEWFFWRGSDGDCRLDRTVGRGKCAVSICKTPNAAKPYAAWNTYSWPIALGLQPKPFQRWRFSAIVKTNHGAGEVRLVYAVSKNGTEFFYGNGTHDAENRRRTDIIDWYDSPALTGTNDWTPIECIFTVQGGTGALVMEQIGAGQSWFDGIRLEPLDTVAPADFMRTEDFSDGGAEGWYCTNTRFPAHTDEGIVIPRTFPGSLSVQTGNTPGLVLSTDGVSLPEPLTLKKRLMPLNQPFDLSLTVEIGVSRASLLICEAFGAVEWANGTVRLPDGTQIIGRKSVTVTVRCEADATRCTVTTEDAEQTVSLPFCPTNASDVAIRIPAGEDGFLTVKQFSFHFLPLEADARRV